MIGPDGQAFRCRRCDGGSMAVVDTRATEGGEVRRRRACACGFRITTFEIEMHDVQGGRRAHLRTLEAKAARYDALVALMAEPLSGGA